MLRPLTCFLLLFVTAASAVIIDRIAIIVGNAIVKNSDIERDVRATDFLNGQPLSITEAARKEAANRLIDQIFIRHEIYIGDYPTATVEEADTQIANLEKTKFRSNAALEQALKRYGLSDAELRTQFRWHLTVLRFIAARFRPAVLVTDDEIDKYYAAHRAALARQYPGKSLDDLRETIRDSITGENVNKLFFSWLDEQRKENKIVYLEKDLA